VSADFFCLIGGSGRSGSTILGKIFASHPDLIDFPESRILIDPDGLVEFYASLDKSWSPYAADRRLRRLEKLLRVCGKRKFVLKYAVRVLQIIGLENVSPIRLRPSYLGTELEKIIPGYSAMVDDLMNELITFTYRGAWVGMPAFGNRTVRFCKPDGKDAIRQSICQFYNEIFRRRREQVGGTKFFEKNTFSILFFDQIRELFPGVRLVHIYRDPRDVVSSYMKQEWSPGNVGEAALWYKGILSQWNKVRARVPEDSYIEISLEAMVANPQLELRRICKFWDIEWDPVLLDVPLDKANAGRWRQECSVDEQATLMDILAPEIEQYGYE